MMKTKTYADRTLEKQLRALGCQVQVFWEEKGPRDTDIAWQTFLCVSGDGGSTTLIVQTFGAGGWSAYQFTPKTAAEIATEVTRLKEQTS